MTFKEIFKKVVPEICRIFIIILCIDIIRVWLGYSHLTIMATPKDVILFLVASIIGAIIMQYLIQLLSSLKISYK